MSYTKKVFYFFQNPINVGEIKNPDAYAQVGNPVCGDVMKMYLKIEEKNNRGKREKYIKDIKFQTLGCAAAIATSSVTTKLAKGKSLLKARKISKTDVAQFLGGLPKVKLHCSILAVEALNKALDNYEKKHK